MVVFSRLIAFTNRYPIVRGIISYGTIWPTSCIIQQTMSGKRWDNYDWMHALRFSIYGGLFAAPTFYAWIRISTRLWPQRTIAVSVKKAIVEQLTYSPLSLVCFFFGMSLLEGKSVEQARDQVEEKVIPTWKVGVCVWPIVQTVNYWYITEKNRVPFVGACSLVWCCFLAYMHELELQSKQEQQQPELVGLVKR